VIEEEAEVAQRGSREVPLDLVHPLKDNVEARRRREDLAG
jgi:hypothetical protein